MERGTTAVRAGGVLDVDAGPVVRRVAVVVEGGVKRACGSDAPAVWHGRVVTASPA